MAKKRKEMGEEELAAILDGQIADAVSYDQSELADRREKALQYIEGEMVDTPGEEGKSQVVSYTVRDTIAWILPGVLRVFLSSDHVATFEPVEMGDEEFVDQATDLVNHIFIKECDGYMQLYSSFYDGLSLGNGVLKHYWSTEAKTKVEEYSGLGEDVYLSLVGNDDIEVLEHTQSEEEPIIAPDGSQLPPQVIHAVKIKRTIAAGSFKVEALPAEDFLIERDAKVLDDDVRFTAHVETPTRSQLIARGYDRDKVYSLPAWTGGSEDSTERARNRRSQHTVADEVHKSVERVRIFECYPLIDFDGDGIAERRQVVMADRTASKGGEKGNERVVLKNTEWPGDLPFTDLVPDPVPHRWRGRSIFEKAEDIQRITTVLQRQTLDNIYRVNNPQREVVNGSVENMDALINNEIGETVLVNQSGAVRDLSVPFVANHSFSVLRFYDDVLAKRTGVSDQSIGLDPEVLQNQTAEAVSEQKEAAQSMIELYARNVAEVGLKRLFRCLLRLIIKHQDRPKTIRLRDKWVEMDPRSWNADMDVTVNVGLGAGSRDRDLATLGQIMQIQRQIVEGLGQENPLVGLRELRNSFAKFIESAGLRTPEQFVKEIDEQAQPLGQQQPDMDPETKAEIAKGQAELQMKMQEAQAKITLEREKIQANMALKREQIGMEMELKREQLAAELNLKRELALADAAANAATSAVHVGGEPG